MRYFRPSNRVEKTRRWKSLRIYALRRDGWQCVKCGRNGRLEVDHIEPVRDRPDLSYSLQNLQTLCPRCHAQKTRIEMGFDPRHEEREKWRNALITIASKGNK